MCPKGERVIIFPIQLRPLKKKPLSSGNTRSGVRVVCGRVAVDREGAQQLDSGILHQRRGTY